MAAPSSPPPTTRRSDHARLQGNTTSLSPARSTGQQGAGEEVQLQGKGPSQVRSAVEKSKKTSNDLLQEKVVPQFVKNSEGGEMTKVQRLLLKFDKKEKQDVVFIGKQKTIPYCGDNSLIGNNIVRKQMAEKTARRQEDVQQEDALGTGAKKQEDRDHGTGTLTEARAIFSRNSNPQSNLKRLLSQHLEATPGQLQPSVDIFCDLPMEGTGADDITA